MEMVDMGEIVLRVKKKHQRQNLLLKGLLLSIIERGDGDSRYSSVTLSNAHPSYAPFFHTNPPIITTNRHTFFWLN
jgi:hypothetical protein